MRLHVIARLYQGENQKGRPSFYSKLTSLASLLSASELAEARVTLLADGPISDELRTLAEFSGTVVELRGGPVGMRRSFMSAIDVAVGSDWPEDDLVYLCEDDYLHHLDALVLMKRAAAQLLNASYFALYASTPDHPAIPGQSEHTVPPGWTPQPSATVDGLRWVNVPSTTSTFAARVGSLRQDRGILRQSLLPYRKRLLDHESFLVMQGHFPYSRNEVFVGPTGTRFRAGPKLVAANAFLTPFRVAYQVRALTRRHDPHLLYVADPNLASHMESDALAPATDWSEIAKQANEWLRRRSKDAF